MLNSMEIRVLNPYLYLCCLIDKKCILEFKIFFKISSIENLHIVKD